MLWFRIFGFMVWGLQLTAGLKAACEQISLVYVTGQGMEYRFAWGLGMSIGFVWIQTFH